MARPRPQPHGARPGFREPTFGFTSLGQLLAVEIKRFASADLLNAARRLSWRVLLCSTRALLCSESFHSHVADRFRPPRISCQCSGHNLRSRLDMQVDKCRTGWPCPRRNVRCRSYANRHPLQSQRTRNSPDRCSRTCSTRYCANPGSHWMSPKGSRKWIPVCVQDFSRFSFHNMFVSIGNLTALRALS